MRGGIFLYEVQGGSFRRLRFPDNLISPYINSCNFDGSRLLINSSLEGEGFREQNFIYDLSNDSLRVIPVPNRLAEGMRASRAIFCRQGGAIFNLEESFLRGSERVYDDSIFRWEELTNNTHQVFPTNRGYYNSLISDQYCDRILRYATVGVNGSVGESDIQVVDLSSGRSAQIIESRCQQYFGSYFIDARGQEVIGILSRPNSSTISYEGQPVIGINLSRLLGP